MNIATAAGVFEVRIVRFWHGDSVLEIKVHVRSSRQPAGARTLLTGGQVTDPSVLAGYLSRFIADLGPDVGAQDCPAT